MLSDHRRDVAASSTCAINKELAPSEDQGVLFAFVNAPEHTNLDYLTTYTDRANADLHGSAGAPERLHDQRPGQSTHTAFVGLILKPWERARAHRHSRSSASCKASSAAFPASRPSPPRRPPFRSAPAKCRSSSSSNIPATTSGSPRCSTRSTRKRRRAACSSSPIPICASRRRRPSSSSTRTRPTSSASR